MSSHSSTDMSTVIQFACTADEDGAVPFPFCQLADNSAELHVRPVHVTLKDIRPSLQAGQRPTLDVQGFEVIDHVYPGLQEDIDDVWMAEYERQMERLLCQHLKARRVVSFAGVAVRRRNPELDDAPIDTENLQPSAGAHVDGNTQTGREVCTKVLELSDEEADTERYAVINLWRPLRGPLVDAPLALCDTRTTGSADIIPTLDFYGPGSYIKYSDRQQWYYLRDMMPDEALLFRCQDSTMHPDKGGITPHTGVWDEERRNDSYRQSIEVRCAVLY
ncbi:BZ3500_MvSof-1268-A1-R1_Chr1-3g02199 [Microbotryum saponariae]|uniref:BZ3500_MvSof-1268-A1-R1_Chr1-3g02199 protein n=1 Tax=Microbotryum saponariae TaxID=289078 RepID=A0A2X0LHT6_9BASI|nr:BZ3500_MvSof-1268-A1-R1_Chr1-3g02199 [Microbotryum saponariae]SCZ95633.1 BZ3501_MvSof-1269-A2-R1_Chr1-3g01802 [Microbotryum saponariae]